MKHPSGLGGEREGGGRRGGGRGATKQSAKKATALGTPRRKGGSSRTTDSSKANVKSKGGKRASPEVEGGEDEDEWAEWYAEMAQYEGWERGEGSNIAGSLVVVDPSIPADVAQVHQSKHGPHAPLPSFVSIISSSRRPFSCSCARHKCLFSGP
jgi:hypothetical protein